MFSPLKRTFFRYQQTNAGGNKKTCLRRARITFIVLLPRRLESKNAVQIPPVVWPPIQRAFPAQFLSYAGYLPAGKDETKSYRWPASWNAFGSVQGVQPAAFPVQRRSRAVRTARRWSLRPAARPPDRCAARLDGRRIRPRKPRTAAGLSAFPRDGLSVHSTTAVLLRPRIRDHPYDGRRYRPSGRGSSPCAWRQGDSDRRARRLRPERISPLSRHDGPRGRLSTARSGHPRSRQFAHPCPGSGGQGISLRPFRCASRWQEFRRSQSSLSVWPRLWNTRKQSPRWA